MRRPLLAPQSIAGAFALLLVTGCLTAAPDNVLVPSQIDPRLATLDADNPFLGTADPDDRVDYVEVEMSNYDAFFRDAATIQGTIVLTNNLVETLSATLNSNTLQQAISSDTLSALYGGATNISDSQRRTAVLALIGGDILGVASGLQETQLRSARDSFFAANPEIDALRTQLEVLVPILNDVPTRAQSLVSSGQNLVEAAPSDFLGPDAMKIPSVLGGLNASLRDLGSAASASTRALSGLQSLFGN
jgi:hypothetical protein